jgi:hypothetical protein
MAMDMVDRQDNPTTGKFSTAWWTRQINYAMDILAQETGFYRIWHPISTVANVREYALPSSYCFGVMEARYEGMKLTPRDVYQFQADYPSRYDDGSSTPIQYAIDGQMIELYPCPARTVTSAGAILASTAGGNFSNQPSNDGIEVLSDSAADTTQTLTVYGTRFQTGTVVEETITLSGTTAVASVKTDFGDILGMELSAACAGTVTVREASGNATITTIAPAATSKGIASTTDTDGGMAYPLIAASGTSTAVIGLYGTDDDGTVLYDNCVALCGTASTTRALPKRMNTITKVLLGALASSQTVAVTRGAALEIKAGAVPADMSGETDTPTGLPSAFHIYLAHGAAAMAEVADIYESQQQARASVHQQAFWHGRDLLLAFLNAGQMERSESMGRDMSLYYQEM